ncbi:hypothetical protein ACWKWU_07860 [Chitinophaga lutea]
MLDRVAQFLSEVHEKLKEGKDIQFLEKDRATESTLYALEMWEETRRDIISRLVPQDYIKGPIVGKDLPYSPRWAFGYLYKGTELYIEMYNGNAGEPLIVIRFCIADHPLSFPFKK